MNMRLGILAGSFPAAARIYGELKAVADCEVKILLCKRPGESLLRLVAKQVALIALRGDRLQTLRVILSGNFLVLNGTLDEPKIVEKLTKLKLDVGLHNFGVIYREPTIKAFKLGILNAHIGLLPKFRGRSVMEWALINGEPTGVSVFFIDAGIDTGERIVLSEQVDISHCRSLEEAKEYLFSLDAVFYRRSIDLVRSQNFVPNRNVAGYRYYPMSRLLCGVVNQLIRANE